MEIKNEDLTLIENFLKGDKESFTYLVKKYEKKIFDLVYSLIGKDKEVEDIVQEVFLKVYNNLIFFRKKSQFFTWLYRITINTTYDFLRKRKIFIDKLENITNNEDPKDTLIRKEKYLLLEKALLKIPLKFKIPLILKEIEGLSYKEIASILHCYIGTVESRIYRGRLLLKEEFMKLAEEK